MEHSNCNNIKVEFDQSESYSDRMTQNTEKALKNEKDN